MDGTQDTHTSDSGAGASRRNLLRLAGAAMVGGAATSLLASQAADAATGTMQFGASNAAGAAATTLTSSVAVSPTIQVANTSGQPDVPAIEGVANAGGTGVRGTVITNASYYAAGVEGSVAGAYAIAVTAKGGRAQLQLGGVVKSPLAQPIGMHDSGELCFDDLDGDLWFSVKGGMPAVWRKLAGSSTAGSLHPIAPVRAYDSRKPLPGPMAPLFAGQHQLVSVADGHHVTTGAVTVADAVPVGATAVQYNVTVVDTIGHGYLAVNVGGDNVVAASAINWFGNSQSLANGSLVKLNDNREVTVVCGGAGAACNFIIDIVGYYL